MARRDDELPIALVIPTWNEARRIGACLESVRRLGFSEIVVSDGGSTDVTLAVATAFPDVTCITAKRGRGSQLRAGIAASSAPVVVMLHADTVLPDDAVSMVREALTDRAVVGGCFHVKFDDPRRSLRLFAWFSRFDTVLTSFGDQAIFARRRVLGGSDVPDWPLLEDVAIRSHLRRRGRFVKLPAAVTTAARRFTHRGIWRCQFWNGVIIAGYFAGVSPARLAALYGSTNRPDS